MFSKIHKYYDRGLVRLFVLFGALGLMLVIHSCRNPPAFTITGRSEVERFMLQNEDIAELFDLSVYASDTFELDRGSATFRTARISSATKGALRFVGEDTTTNALGKGLLLTVTRHDNYEGTFGQRSAPTTDELEVPYQARLTRRALFMKLGSDDDRFFGWELVGVKLGRRALAIPGVVTITRHPAPTGFPTVLSDVESGGAVEDGFITFFSIKPVNAGDSIDIQTKLGPMTIFARTITGHRQLKGFHISSEPAGVFHYGYRTPPADFQNQFYHLITFQSGPEVVIDSTIFNLFISDLVEFPLEPPDTQFVLIQVADTLIDSLFFFFDTCADTAIIDSIAMDSCILREFDRIDTTINFSTIIETNLITIGIDTIYDSVLAPDSSLRNEDLWVFPYSVR